MVKLVAFCGAITTTRIKQLIKTKSLHYSAAGRWQGLQGRAERSRSRCRMCCLGSRGCNAGDPNFLQNLFLQNVTQMGSFHRCSLVQQAINEAASQAAGGDNKNRYIALHHYSPHSFFPAWPDCQSLIGFPSWLLTWFISQLNLLQLYLHWALPRLWFKRQICKGGINPIKCWKLQLNPKVWDVSTGQCLFSMVGHDNWVRGV